MKVLKEVNVGKTGVTNPEAGKDDFFVTGVTGYIGAPQSS